MQPNEKVVLREEEIARALTRIAHEIVERNPIDVATGARRHPPSRRASSPARLHAAARASCPRPRCRSATLDIGFYRDDVGTRARRSGPARERTSTSTLAGATVVIVDDVLFTGRTVRAAIEALFDYGRPERVQLAVLVDRGHRELPIRPDYVGKNLPTSLAEHVNVRVREIDGVDEVAIADAERRCRLMRAPALDRGTRPRRHRADRRPGRSASPRSPTARSRRCPRCAGGMVLNLFYEASTRTRSSFELAAKRLSADVVNFAASGSSVEKGESLKDTVLTLSARTSPTRSCCARPGRGPRSWSRAGAARRSSTPATASTSTPRRRCSTSTRCAPPRLASTAQLDLDRRRRGCTRAWRARTSWPSSGWAPRSRSPGRPTLIPRGIEALGCEVRYTLDELRAADVVYALRMQHERMKRDLGALAARVRRLVPDQRPAPDARAGADAPRPGQPRRRALGRGRRLAAGA